MWDGSEWVEEEKASANSAGPSETTEPRLGVASDEIDELFDVVDVGDEKTDVLGVSGLVVMYPEAKAALDDAIDSVEKMLEGLEAVRCMLEGKKDKSLVTRQTAIAR